MSLGRAFDALSSGCGATAVGLFVVVCFVGAFLIKRRPVDGILDRFGLPAHLRGGITFTCCVASKSEYNISPFRFFVDKIGTF